MVLEIIASSLFDATRSAGLHRVFVRQHTLPQVRLPKQWRLCSRSFFTECFQSAESTDYSLCTVCADSAVFGCISFSAAFLFVPRGFTRSGSFVALYGDFVRFLFLCAGSPLLSLLTISERVQESRGGSIVSLPTFTA